MSASFITQKLQLDLREAGEGRRHGEEAAAQASRKAGSRFWTEDRFVEMSQLFTVFRYHIDKLDVRD